MSRPAAEPRIVDDPEWPGRHDLTLAWRMVEAYASAQFKYGSVFYGQMDRNWGPVGISGIGLSNYGYSEVESGFDLGTRTLRLHMLARPLNDEDSLGNRVHRYFFAHRVGVRVSNKLNLGAVGNRRPRGRGPPVRRAVSQSPESAAPGRSVRARARRERGRSGSTPHGGRLAASRSRPNWASTICSTSRHPGRNATPIAGRSPSRHTVRWERRSAGARSTPRHRAWPSGRIDPFENLTDAGVGIGRNFDDQDQATLTVTVPRGTFWLFTPELTLLRQGEGRIDDPFPSAAEAGSVPQLFIGVVERTWRAALGISGRQGPLDVAANAGFHHVVNADHIEGHTVNRFEGRLQATLGLGRRGVLQ